MAKRKQLEFRNKEIFANNARLKQEMIQMRIELNNLNQDLKVKKRNIEDIQTKA